MSCKPHQLVLWIACFVTCGDLEAAQPKLPQPAMPATMPPYLQNPAPDSITVCFLAQKADKVRVAWRRDVDNSLVEVPAKETAVPGTPWTVWKTRLSGMGPGSTRQYRVRYRLEGKARETPAYRFRTPDPKAESFLAAFFNDVHNNIDTLAAVMRYVKPEDYEVAFLLGDMWTNPDAANKANRVFRTMDTYIRLFNASERPMFLIRGNHETIGNFADKMALLFDLPDLDASAAFGEQNWYFSYQPGPVWFLRLDSGDDFIKRYELFQPYRKRQAE